jgi:hypothetical protein
MLDQVTMDLAGWIDEVADQLAEGIMVGGTAPFAAQITEADKLRYYRDALFNPDGSPNMQGRTREMQRLGPESFATMYKAVLKANPQLAVPAPPEGAPIPPPLGAPTYG